jgi:hypothetical protein
MNIVGRRFLTWVSVWVFSFFVRGELSAAPQERPKESVTDGTSNTNHKVPQLKTQSMIKKRGAGLNDKTIPKSKTAPVGVYGKTFPKSSSEIPMESLKTTSKTSPRVQSGNVFPKTQKPKTRK